MKNNNKLKLFLCASMLALGLSVPSASWANSLTFQGVTFDLTTSGSTLDLHVYSATGVTGDWIGVNGFAAFEVKDIGTASGLGLSGWTVFDTALGNNGCINGSTSGGCFVRNSGPLSFTSSGAFDLGTFSITKGSGAFSLTSPPHLKVIFTTNGTTNPSCLNNQNDLSGCVTGKTGELMSKDIPVGQQVPEPASLLLLGAGLAGLGIWRRRQA